MEYAPMMNGSVKYVPTNVSVLLPTLNASITKNRLSTPAVEILVTIDVVFICLCLFGNLFVLVTTIRTKTLHTPSFLFIISVVLGHLLIGFAILPMFIVGHFPEKYMTTPICKVMRYLMKIASNASILSLLPLTYDSCRRHGRFRRKTDLTFRTAIIQFACVWVVAVVYAIFFPIIYKMVEKIHPYPNHPTAYWSTVMCDFDPKHTRTHKIFVLIDISILYIIPAVSLSLMYCQIFWGQWKVSSKHKHEIDEKVRAAVTKSGALFLMAFIICNVGSYTILMYVNWGPGHFWNVHLWQSVAALMTFAQSWLNVLLLVLFNKPFRQAVFKYRVSCKHDQLSSAETNQLKNGTKTEEPVTTDMAMIMMDTNV